MWLQEFLRVATTPPCHDSSIESMKRTTIAKLGVLGMLVMAGMLWLWVGEGRQLLEPGPTTAGDEMAFGGFDPHLHAAVVEVFTRDESTETGAVFPSRRVFVNVRLRSSAVEVPVDPGRLSYVIVSHRGGRYEPEFVVTDDGVRRPWTGPPDRLQPGESVELGLEFVIPQAMDNPRLWIVERSWILRYLPWLEETPLFPKIAIALRTSER